MLKRIKNLFSNSPLNNDKGSALSVALIVITVLTFSLTTVTSLNVNLAGATTVKLSQVNDDSIAKGLISQAISEYEAYIILTDSYVDFNNVEIPRIFLDYGVIVTDVSGTGDFLEYAGTESYVYKFAYPMDSGNTLYKYSFSSINGSTIIPFETFDYSIATNGDLLLNGGVYDEVKLYGNNVMLANSAPYISDSSGSRLLIPSLLEEFPLLTNSVASEIFVEDGYKYCNAGCFNPITDPFRVDFTIYEDVMPSTDPLLDKGILSDTIINDFFGGFDYDANAITFLTEIGPTESQTFNTSITDVTLMAAEILANQSDFLIWKNKNVVETYPSTPYVNITGDTNIDFTKQVNLGNMDNQGISVIYQGDLTITENLFSNSERDSIIIDGNLTIDNAGTNKLNLEGSIFVTGDLVLTGNDIDFEGTFFVLGETHINFDIGEGITTPGNNLGFTLISKDNIIIEEIYESHTTDALSPEFSVFLYTEESIYIDAVNSRLNVSGSLFAKALGNSSNVLMEDSLGNPLYGIFINSIRGYMNNDVGVESDNDHFNITFVDSANYTDRFLNVPIFESLVTIPGLYAFNTSEWQIE